MNLKLIKRTATDWAKLAGFELVDPDGWRGKKDGVTTETPIDIFDFAHRANESTIRPIEEKTPRLIYNSDETNANRKGQEVKVGDQVKTSRGENVTVEFFRFPHKPSSQGKISVKGEFDTFASEFYVSVIGAEWIDRNDRD
jgi:hypothetical protein